MADPPISIEDARRLTAITREAAARAYEADAGTAGKISTWLMTVLTTLHAGGLLAAIQNSDKIPNDGEVRAALLIGLIATILGGSAALIHFNSLTDRWRHEMHMELEGATEISVAANAHGEVAHLFDRIASSLFAVSVIALGVAGTYII